MIAFYLSAVIAASPPLPAISPGSREIEIAESRGQRMYRYNRLAPSASALAEQVLEDRLAETRGYTVSDNGDTQTLTFIGLEDEKPYAIWRGIFRNAKQVSGGFVPVGSKSASPTVIERDIFNAQRAALSYVFNASEKEGLKSCAGDVMPNLVVLTPTTTDPDLNVYIVSPQTDKDVVPLGGHYRVTLDKDLNANSFRSMTEGCHDIDLFHDGQRLVATHVRHKLEPFPNEIHVFVALEAEARLEVYTGDADRWTVEKGRIHREANKAGR